MEVLSTKSKRTDLPELEEPELASDSYLLSALLENTTDNIYFKDLESRFVRINCKQARFLGLPDPSDAIGKSDHDFFASEHSFEARQDEIEIIRSGHPLIGKEEREDWPDGSITWASTSKMPLFGAEGRCIGTFGISRDITSARESREALLESEARFRDLTNAIHEVLWILDVRSNTTLYVSPAYEDIWGRPCTQFYANVGDWLAAIHDEDRARIESRFSTMADQPIELTFRIVRPDGEVRWIRSREFPILDQEGALLRVVGVSADITKARAANQELGKSQRLLASIVNSSNDAIIGQSLDGSITAWNPSSQQIFGYDHDEVIGAPASILLRTDQNAEESWILDQIQKGLCVRDFKTERCHKNGSAIPISLTASPLRDESGQIVGLSIQAHNISNRKELEDRLSTVSEQLRAVLESTNEYVIALDHEWRVTYQNKLPSGEDPTTVIGVNLWNHSPYFVGTPFERESRRAMTERRACRFDEFIPTLKSWMSGVAYPTGTGLLILMRDETEKHALDDQLRSSQRMQAIGHLAAGVAHEINTPIQYIGDNTDFLKGAWDQIVNLLSAAQRLHDEAELGQVTTAAIAGFAECGKAADVDFLVQEVPRAIDQTLDGVQRVAKIVGAMKEFSHPGSPEKCASNLNRAIEAAVTISHNEWKYVADVETNLDPDLPLVPCLAGEINQVLLNLLVNAAHAIGDVVENVEGGRGKISISTRTCDDFVEISVADTGTGIPEQIRDKVFDPFFTTKDVGKGTGQGLMLAHAVVVGKHGGSIWFETEVGKGTTFYFRLPLSEVIQS